MAEAIVLEWVLPGATTAVVTAVAGPPGQAVWGTFTGVLADQADLQAALDGRLAVSAVGVTVQGYSAELATVAGLAPSNDDIIQRKAGAWTRRTPVQFKTDLALVKGDVGLGNVENTALSAWGGSANLATVGTVTAGTWTAGAIAPAYGGTGLTSYAVGDLIYASGAATLARLADVATGNVLVSGGIGAAPAWGKVGLASHVSGTLPVANGGTGQTTAGAALNALLPAQAGAGGKFLTSDGTNPAWGTPVTGWGTITGTLSAQADLQTALDAKLAVAGGLMTGALGVVAGAVGTPGIYASGDPNTGLWFPAADTMAASAGGQEAWRIDSLARVGVNMTTLAAQFSVQSNGAARVASIIKGAGSQSANMTEWQASNGTLLAAIDAGGHMSINKAVPSSSVILNIAGASNERVDTTGNAYGIQVGLTNQLSGNLIAMQFQAESRYSGAGVTLVGVQGICSVNSGAASTANLMIGFQAQSPILNSGATVTAAYGVRIDAQNTTGVGSAWALYAGGANDNSYLAHSLLIGQTSVPASLKGGLVLGNAAAIPTGNVAGGTVYVEAGALKYRGSSGTVTVLAVA
ncbi:hypothetical protein QO010_000385 [Caulobacter ginsengisoli]|uniref:Uncharacterized protein n=1 Tax=Caulobacter ginsengisoli TaxID=400775 RepID=A0ABU0IKV7_9CAUL|nr:hypothetical protein [Caulobacter ginsengisoli]MDQ0462637.1 hypothetical protein [Caulobacter ginsengisoli]